MRGFTLVELVIAMVILLILAGVGYPLYQDQVRKARRTDARTAAMQIALAEEQYYSREAEYFDYPDFNDSDKRKKMYLTSDVTKMLENKTSASGYYDLAITTPTDETFTVEVTPATGKSQAKDTDCTKFVIDQAGRKSAEGSNPQRCW